MKLPTPKANVVYERSDAPYIHIRLGVKDAELILQNHENITKIVHVEISRALEFIKNNGS